MFNRGGGDLEWRAESDEDWIGLEQFEDFVRVTLEPRSPGTNKGTVYVRDGRGHRACARPCRDDLVRGPRVGSGADTRGRSWPPGRSWERSRSSGSRSPLISDGVDGGRPVRTEMVLEWHHEQLDPSDAPGRIEAIGGPAMAAEVSMAMPLHGRSRMVNGTRSRPKMGTATRRSMVSRRGMDRGSEWVDRIHEWPGCCCLVRLHRRRHPDAGIRRGDQGTRRSRAPVSIDRDRLVAVDMTVMTRPSGLSAAATTPGSDSATRTHSGRRRTGDAPCGTDRRCRREPVADRGRLPEGGRRRRWAVWITRDDEGRGWERITGDGLPFVGRVVSDSSTSPGCGTAATSRWVTQSRTTGTGLTPRSGSQTTEERGPKGNSRSRSVDQAIGRSPSERFGGVGRPAVYHRGGEGGSDGSWNAALWYSDDAEEWVKQQTGGTELGGSGSQELLSFFVDDIEVLVVGQGVAPPAIWRGTCAGHELCSQPTRLRARQAPALGGISHSGDVG